MDHIYDGPQIAAYQVCCPDEDGRVFIVFYVPILHPKNASHVVCKDTDVAFRSLDGMRRSGSSMAIISSVVVAAWTLRPSSLRPQWHFDPIVASTVTFCPCDTVTS